MFTDDKVTEIFCLADDFYKFFEFQTRKYAVDDVTSHKKRHYHRKPLEYESFVKEIYGRLVGDKGYIKKELFDRLFVDGIQLTTKLKRNMKGAVMSLSDRLLQRKRAIIETVNDELKNIAQVEHSRHRSFGNFVVNTLAAIAAYCFFPKKPTLHVDRELDSQLALF